MCRLGTFNYKIQYSIKNFDMRKRYATNKKVQNILLLNLFVFSSVCFLKGHTQAFEGDLRQTRKKNTWLPSRQNRKSNTGGVSFCWIGIQYAIPYSQEYTPAHCFFCSFAGWVEDPRYLHSPRLDFGFLSRTSDTRNYPTKKTNNQYENINGNS